MAGRRDQLAAALYGFVLVAVVAGSSGGFRPTTWGWTAVATLWLAAIALLLYDQVEVGALELGYVGAIFTFTGWVALSNLWTPSVTSTMHEVQRDLAYVGVIASGVLIVRRSSTSALLGGVLGGIVLIDLYALGTRLLPDRIGGFNSTAFDYRLSAPITYWNGLGIFTTLGLLLGLGFAARACRLVVRGLAAAALPLLAATVYFTFSRGAWYALAVGLIAAIAIDPRRLQLIATTLAIAPWPVLAIVEVRRSDGLVTIGATLHEATHDGRRLLPVLVSLAVVSGVVAIAAGLIESRLLVPRAIRTAFVVLLVAAFVVGIAGIWTTRGSPVVLAKRGWRAFQGPTAKGSQGDVGARLLSLGADNRIQLWEVSFRDFKRAPLVGQGAATFWQDWARYRTIHSESTQAHSLYIGALGELGIVGTLLILGLVLVPFAGALSTRRLGLVPAAFGAFAAWAVHAGVDWDWGLLGVTIPALLCGVSLLPSRALQVPTWRIRALGAIAAGALLVVATTTLVADLKLRSAESQAGRRPAAALSDARSAKRLAPWSSEPYLVIADVYTRHRRSALARQALQQAVAKDSSSWILWRLLANQSAGAPRREARLRFRELNPFLAG